MPRESSTWPNANIESPTVIDEFGLLKLGRFGRSETTKRVHVVSLGPLKMAEGHSSSCDTMHVIHMTDAELVPLVPRVSRIVKVAARFLRRSISQVGPGPNPRTDIDLAVHRFLRKELRAVLPIPVLSEEDAVSPPGGTTLAWVIDPIDGTLNLLAGSPDVAISVALVDRQKKGQASVVFLPGTNELFTAVRGCGSSCNGRPLTLMRGMSSRQQPSILAFGIPGDPRRMHRKIVRAVGNAIAAGLPLRESGSAALDICRVANGTWSGFFQFGLYFWDVAAADLILREAGGRSGIRFQSNQLRCDYIAAADPIFMKALRSTIDWDVK